MSRPLMSKYETCRCRLSHHRQFLSGSIFERGDYRKKSKSYEMYPLMFLLDRSWLSLAPVEVERYLSVVCFVDIDVIVKFDGASNGTGENEDERQGRIQRRAVERY